MKLYLISQDQYDGYDVYDSAVVAAENEDEARRVHPGAHYKWDNVNDAWFFCSNGGSRHRAYGGDWADHINRVDVKCLGVAICGTKPGVICASFNAG